VKGKSEVVVCIPSAYISKDIFCAQKDTEEGSWVWATLLVTIQKTASWTKARNRTLQDDSKGCSLAQVPIKHEILSSTPNAKGGGGEERKKKKK
jgi:hypothetical protein